MEIILTVILIALIVATAFMLNSVHEKSKRQQQVVKQNHGLLSEAVRTATSLYYDVQKQCYYNIYGSYVPQGGVSRDTLFKLLDPRDVPVVDKTLCDIADGRVEKTRISFRIKRDFSEPAQWINYRGFLRGERNSSGRVANIYHTLYDVTEEVSQAEKMEGQTWIYQQCFEQSKAGLAYYNKDGVLEKVNPRMLELFQPIFDTSELEKANLFDLEPFHTLRMPGDIDPLYVCTRFVRRDGKGYLFYEVRLFPVFSSSGDVLFLGVTIVDVTDLRDIYLSVQRKRRESKDANERANVYKMQFSHLLQFVNLVLWRPDMERRVFVISDDVFTEHDGKGFDELADTIYDDSKEAFQHLLHVINTGAEEEVKFTLHEKPQEQGGTDHWYIVSGIPVTDENGKKGYFGMRRDITNLVRVEEELRLETERANNSSELKATFLANMTHEIRTPLNAIVGFSELLGNVEGDDKKEFVSIIKRNSDLLTRLLDDILTLSNIDSEKLESVPKPVDFASTFHNIFLSISQRLAVPGVEFIEDNPAKTLNINVDRERVEQVINNFATNASKNTKQGHIKLGYSYDGRELRVYCEDTGSGIPKDKQETIFDRFVKLDYFVQGTGLGLSICKAIAKGCGGDIGVMSEVGKGSTFWLTVPCTMSE